jgi:hypothetical protein
MNSIVPEIFGVPIRCGPFKRTTSLDQGTATLIRRPAQKFLVSSEDFVKPALYTLLKTEGFLLANMRTDLADCWRFMNASVWEKRICSHTEPLFGKVAFLQLCFYLNTAEKAGRFGSPSRKFSLGFGLRADQVPVAPFFTWLGGPEFV